MPTDTTHPIVLFDGVCNYCNGWVNFIIRHDKKNKFRFAPLQSEAAKKLSEQYQFPLKIETVVLIDNGKTYFKSTAGLRILKHLNILSIFYIFIFVPAFIRDFAYDIIAKNRYHWWGKKDTCMIPTPEVKEKFLA